MTLIIENTFSIEWQPGYGSPIGPAQHQPEFLGAFLPRETALYHPRIDRLWHAAGHIVLGDPRLAAIEAWLKLG